jgi:hypothetical protein
MTPLEAALAEYLRRTEANESTASLLQEHPELGELAASELFQRLQPVDVPAASPEKRSRARALMLREVESRRGSFLRRLFSRRLRFFGVSAIVVTAGLGASVASGAARRPQPQAKHNE